MRRSPIDDAVDGTEQSWPHFVVKGDDDGHFGQLCWIIPMFTPKCGDGGGMIFTISNQIHFSNDPLMNWLQKFENNSPTLSFLTDFRL